MNSYKLSEIPQLRILGRTNGTLDPLTLFWTASGIEFNIRAREVRITVEADYQLFEPWIVVIIDGTVSQRLMLTKGIHEICIHRAWDAGITRNIRVLRDTQAMPDDRKTRLQIHSIQTNGHFEPVSAPSMRLEYVGDSITSGYGCGGSVHEQEESSAIFDCTKSYPFLTSELLHAEYRVLSTSGWGIYCSWQGYPDKTIPSCYEQICGLMRHDLGQRLSAADAWDFSLWQPDAVIINLGTNDAASFLTAREIIPMTNFANPMRRNPDGSMHEDDLLSIENAAVDFLHVVRRCNPRAQILWAYGMMGHDLEPTLRRAIQRYQDISGDPQVRYLSLPDTEEAEFGSCRHPGPKAHERISGILAAALAEMI